MSRQHPRSPPPEVFTIRLAAADPFRAEVQSPAGEGTAIVDPSLSLRTAVEENVGEGGLRDFRRSRRAEPESGESFGRQLFADIFGGELGGLLATSLALAAERRRDLRLIWQAETAPQLASLPLERLCDPTGRCFALDPRTPVARLLPAALAPRPVSLPGPLRFLIAAACPPGEDPIDAEGEIRTIAAALRPLIRRGSVRLETASGITLRELAGRLRGGRFHLLHFIGHGFFREDGGLVLESDARGESELIERERLEVLLGPADSLRLVILNCCSSARSELSRPGSGLAQAISRLNLPAVVGMQVPLADRAAIGFADGFYGALAAGRPADVAVNAGRQAMRLVDERPEQWSAPVLFLRDPRAASVFCLPEAPPAFSVRKVGRLAVDCCLDRAGRGGRWLAPLPPLFALAAALVLGWFVLVLIYQLADPRDNEVRRDGWLLGILSLVGAPLAFEIWRGGAARLWLRGFPLSAAVLTAGGVALFAALWLFFLTA